MLRIKEVVKENGLTIEDLAKHLKMNRVSLSRIINGNPTVETLSKIATALGVGIEDLFVPSITDNYETIYVKRDNNYYPVGRINLRSIKPL